MPLKTDCPHCTQLRPLDEHLFELGLACDYLNNQANYTEPGSDSSRLIHTRTIGEWLKLSAQLDSVQINTWKFENDSGYCGSFAEQVESDQKHYSSYAKVLTKFLFITSALEEAYRFSNEFFSSPEYASKMSRKSQLKSPAIRAAIFLDEMGVNFLPKHLKHRTDQFESIFNVYIKRHKLELSGMKYAKRDDVSYGLHLVRNLRNHAAHGVFPLVPNPDYSWSTNWDSDILTTILGHACRLSAMYLQALLARCNQGFKADEYIRCYDSDEPEFAYFIKNCTPTYIKNLHLKQNFSLISAFDYQTKPWQSH